MTGFPAFTARRLVARLLARTADDRVSCWCATSSRNDAVAFQALVPQSSRARLRLVEGDVGDMDLGLPGPDYKALAAEVTAIHHTAAIYYLGAKRELVERVNVDGTRTMLELAADCPRPAPLRALVDGAGVGRALGRDPRGGARLRAALPQRLRGDQVPRRALVRDAARRLPITILRPGIIVGDSRTGEIDKFDGPYYLLVLIVSSPIDVHLPLPGRGSAPLNLVPIDFVVDAAVALARDPRAVGGTFHLTDPAPFSARTVYELVAQRADKKAPRGSIPTGLARALLKAPGLERLARAPLAFLEAFNHLALYNCRHTLTLLVGRSVARALPALRQLRRSAGALRARGAGAARSRRATTRRSTRSTWHEGADVDAAPRLPRRRARNRRRRRAGSDDVDIAKAHFNTGQVNYEHGRFDDAAHEFEEAYRLSGKAPLLYNVGKSYDGGNDFARALDAYQRFLAAAPTDNPDRDFAAEARRAAADARRQDCARRRRRRLDPARSTASPPA